jgi:hypothetical protein
MGDMKFIRKGTGLPFPQGQFTRKELIYGALPGVLFGSIACRARVDVRTKSDPYQLVNFSGVEHFDVTAGWDGNGKPSFLTVEQIGERADWGKNLYVFSAENEARVRTMTLEQSANFVEDLDVEYYVAQWSLVKAPTRKGLRTTRALYDLTTAYGLSGYRSEGVMHVCLGERKATIAGAARNYPSTQRTS